MLINIIFVWSVIFAGSWSVQVMRKIISYISVINMAVFNYRNMYVLLFLHPKCSTLSYKILACMVGGIMNEVIGRRLWTCLHSCWFILFIALARSSIYFCADLFILCLDWFLLILKVWMWWFEIYQIYGRSRKATGSMSPDTHHKRLECTAHNLWG